VFKTIFAAIILALSFAAPVVAGPLVDAENAEAAKTLIWVGSGKIPIQASRLWIPY
jgi:hypothetical protein